MHPLDPYLPAPLTLVEDLWVRVEFTRCDRHGCIACTYVPIRLALRDVRAQPDVPLHHFLRRIVCKTCRVQPKALAMCERADGLGWQLEVHPCHWRRPARPQTP